MIVIASLCTSSLSMAFEMLSAITSTSLLSILGFELCYQYGETASVMLNTIM